MRVLIGEQGKLAVQTIHVIQNAVVACNLGGVRSHLKRFDARLAFKADAFSHGKFSGKWVPELRCILIL